MDSSGRRRVVVVASHVQPSNGDSMYIAHLPLSDEERKEVISRRMRVAVVEGECCVQQLLHPWDYVVASAAAKIFAPNGGPQIGLCDAVHLGLVTHFVGDSAAAVVERLRGAEETAVDALLMRLAVPVPVESQAEVAASLRARGEGAAWRRPRVAGRSRQLYNVWQDVKGFACAGCAPNLPSSLRLVFFDCDGGGVRTEHRAASEGFPGVLHGGTIATVADELSYFAFAKATGKMVAMTKSLEIEFVRPVTVGTFVSATAAWDAAGSRVRVELRSEAGRVCATATVQYVVPREQRMAGFDVEKMKVSFA